MGKYRNEFEEFRTSHAHYFRSIVSKQIIQAVKSERKKGIKSKNPDFALLQKSLKDRPAIDIPMEKWKKKSSDYPVENEITGKDVLSSFTSLKKSRKGKKHQERIDVIQKTINIPFNYSIRLVYRARCWFLDIAEKIVDVQKQIPDNSLFGNHTAIHQQYLEKNLVIASCDPGLICFGTIYMLLGNVATVLMVGDEQRSLMKVLCMEIDVLNHDISDLEGRTPMKKQDKVKLGLLKTELTMKQSKLTSVVDNLHNRTISFIVNNTNHFITSIFDSSMFQKKFTDDFGDIRYKKRGLHRNTVRLMRRLAYCRFIDKLKRAAKKKGNKCQIHIVREPYTSQQCGMCEKKYKVKGSLYECEHCGYKTLRDWNGARNFLIRIFTLYIDETELKELNLLYAGSNAEVSCLLYKCH